MCGIPVKLPSVILMLDFLVMWVIYHGLVGRRRRMEIIMMPKQVLYNGCGHFGHDGGRFVQSLLCDWYCSVVCYLGVNT